MATINQLSRDTSPALGDSIPIFSNSNGNTQRITINDLAAYILSLATSVYVGATGTNGLTIVVIASRIDATTDLNNILECNSASAINITVKASATVPATVNDIITIYQAGAGASLFVADTGVTIQGTAPTPTQYNHIAIRYRGSDIWAWV